MRLSELSIMERLFYRLAERLRENRIPLLCGVGAGLLAHMFAFTNKLVNADEVGALLSKGGGVDYGRWAIDATRFLFPDASMPWIYGVVTVLLFSVSACLILRIFEIRNPFMQALLPVMLLVFPSLTALFCYMFTSAPFALALLLAVLSVYLGCREERLWRWGGCALLVLSLGIYQAYIAVAASLYVLLMICKLLDGETEVKQVFLFGLRAFVRLALSVAIYYLISRLALLVTGVDYVVYGTDERSIVYKLALAYNAFFKCFTRGYFAYVKGSLSMAMHLLLLLFLAAFFAAWFLRCRDWRRGGLMLLCLLLLLLSINCIFLAADPEVIHSVVLYSFTSFYILAVIAGERLAGRPARWGRDLILASMLLISVSNIFLANKTYLKMFLQYEQAYSFYTGVVTQVKETEGFDADTKLAILGRSSAAGDEQEKLDTVGLMGPSDDLINIYTRDLFLRRYLGMDVPFASWGEEHRLMRDERVLAMPCYPYYGSVQAIDGFIVVKLSD